MNGITLLSNISAEFERNRQNNLQNIVHTDFLTLCARQKPESAASKIKPKNSQSVFLLWEVAKNVKKIRRDYKERFPHGRLQFGQ